MSKRLLGAMYEMGDWGVESSLSVLRFYLDYHSLISAFASTTASLPQNYFFI
jgi:hypothetical protein